MPYSTTNPPHLISQRFGGGSPGLWSYSSTDPIATVAGSSYVSDGASLGMKKGDIVFVVNTASTLVSIANVTAVTAGFGATLSSSLATT